MVNRILNLCSCISEFINFDGGEWIKCSAKLCILSSPSSFNKFNNAWIFYLSHFSDRKDELEGEVFEILLTFSDFMSFKEMFLDYRAVSMIKFIWC